MRPAWRRGLARLVAIEETELRPTLWAALYFFFLLASYYVIRPLREEMGISGAGDRLNLLFLGTLAGTLLAAPAFGWLVSRSGRRIFVPFAYRFLIANLLLFWFLLGRTEGADRQGIARVFFVWASVFNLFAVSIFWEVMADLFRSEQGKRLFGFIGAGGTLGAIVGSGLTGMLAPRVGPVHLLLLAAVLLEGAVLAQRRLVRSMPASVASAAADDVPPGRGTWSGMRTVFRSPYLLGIGAFLLLMAISATFLYFEQARIARASFPDPGDRTAFFARIDLWVNGLALATQLAWSGRLISAIGLGRSLSILPATSLGAFVALAGAPTAATLTVVQTLRRAADYAVTRPSREVLFTVLDREAKYSSKNFIDTFVLRAGDALGAGIDLLLQRASWGPGGLAIAFAPVAALWIGLSAWLARRQAAIGGGPRS